MKPARSLKIFSLYYLIIIVLVFFLGIVISVFTYRYVSRNTQEVLLKNSASIASVFETSKISTLAGNDNDLQNPAYIFLKDKLFKLTELDKDIRFAYFWGYRDGYPYFIADSEPATSPDYSPPGQVYTEATATDQDMFLKKLPPSIEINTDRWGTWLSALIPIKDQEGNLIAVMGTDMNASKYLNTVYIYTSIPIITTIFILIIIVIGFVLRKREEEFITFKSELVSIASHEIRSPLTGISWLTQGLLREGDTLSPKQKEDILMIKKRSDGLLSTVNEVLDSTTAEKINKKKLVKQQIPMKALFEEIYKDALLNLSEKNIKFDMNSSITPESFVSGDPDRIKRMFNNLFSNAIKYSKNGGTITVGENDVGENVILWIKDEGIGISEKDKEKIFRGFFRTENAKGLTKNGTGLGLHYVNQIAELHNGKVWCESKEGIGSTFFVELPKK